MFRDVLVEYIVPDSISTPYYEISVFFYPNEDVYWRMLTYDSTKLTTRSRDSALWDFVFWCDKKAGEDNKTWKGKGKEKARRGGWRKRRRKRTRRTRSRRKRSSWKIIIFPKKNLQPLDSFIFPPVVDSRVHTSCNMGSVPKIPWRTHILYICRSRGHKQKDT